MKTFPHFRRPAMVLAVILSGPLAQNSTAAVTPGGTLADKAIIVEAGGGETLSQAAAGGGFGPTLVHDFDTPIALDGTYEVISPTTLALSSGRHLVLYSTRFQALAGANRAEIQTNLTLAGTPLAAGRSQGFIRRSGNPPTGHNDTVMTGGAIITVAADNDVLTLESRRSDVNPDNAVRPVRLGNFTAVQLLKLDNAWDFLSVNRTGDQGGTVGTTAVDVAYGTIDPGSSLGTAFSFTSGSSDITLNETGSYLVFANTGVQKANDTNRTAFQQVLTLNNVAVPGTTTTTYVRGNANAEQANRGVTAFGGIVAATAGDVLNVELVMEFNGSVGTIKGGQTALTIVKLPATAKTLGLLHTVSQEVNDATDDPVIFNTQLTAPISDLSHTAGGSLVTANAAGSYLFFGTVFTSSDAANDNQDRILPLQGWQLNGAGGMINYGHGAQYNRDNANNRTGGSWGAAIVNLGIGNTVQLLTRGIANTDQGASSTTALQALSITSLIPSNDPAIAINLPIEIRPGSTGTITDAYLDTFDADTAPAFLTYTVTSPPAGGTLRHTVNGALGNGATFTQDDIDNNRVVFDAGGAEAAGGFDFTVSDGTASDSSRFIINVAYPTVTLTIVGAGDALEGDTGEWTVFSDIAPVGADLTVDIAYSGTATAGSDFTGAATVTIPAGTTTGSLEVPFATDGLYEGAESVVATITGGSGATTNPIPGTPASARVHILDGGNRAPTGTNLTQVIVGTGTVPLDDITVIDPDGTYSSVVTTAGIPLTNTNGISNVTTFGDGRADDDVSFDLDATGPALSEAAGFSVQIAFVPQAVDLTGVVSIWEIGGSSNGSCIVLIDGIPHLLCKANGVAADTPTDNGDPGFRDLDWATGNQVVVPLTDAPLPVGEETQIAVVFDILGDTVKSSVNGAAEVITSLTPQSGTNFRGDHTVNIGVNAGTGVGGSNSGTGVMGTTAPAEIRNPAGGSAAVRSVLFWNESTGSTSGSAGIADTVTATLTIQGWSATAGDLTATSGNGESYAAGVWSITGTPGVVNAALAAVEFVTNVGTVDPTIILLSLEDGNEDGGGPTLGAIIVSTNAPDPIYVDDSFPSVPGGMIPDADGGPAVAPAIFGFNAFNDLATALANVQPTGTVIVNDGDYSTENIVLADSVTLTTTATAGPVRIGDLGTGLTNSVVVQGANTLELGATNINGPGIDSVISGTGNLTKVGTGLLVLRRINTYTGTTTVNDGSFRVGYRSNDSIQAELAGDGPVIVNAPGLLEFNIWVDHTINQTGAISGDGKVATRDNGTLIFDGASPNTFSGGFELGDGASSLFDGVGTGAKEGFVVLNHSGHLGTGKILSRGGQLQAGSPGLVIANDIDITGGGFRCGGLIDFSFSGTITTIDNSVRGFGNYGLDGLDLTINGNVIMGSAAAGVNFEGVSNKDNGSWTVNGNISGDGALLVQNNFGGGVVTLNGIDNHTGTTTCASGTTYFNATQTGGGAFNVNNASILGGSGTTTSPVTVAAAATLSPGTNGPGTFTCGGLNVLGTLAIDLNGNTPGTGHDQVIVNGTVAVSGSLTVSPGAGLTPGDLVLVANDDGADPVTGTFTGFAEGTVFDSALFGWNGTLTYLAGGGDANDIAIDFGGYTIVGQWRADNYGDSSNTGAGENTAPGPNGRTNLENFALGFDANGSGDSGTLTISGGSITQLGGPQIWEDPMTGRFYFQYTRRTDYVAAGLTMTEEFSRDLTAWEVDPTATASVVATGTGDDGVPIQALQVELPGTLPISGGKARFGRLVISIAP